MRLFNSATRAIERFRPRPGAPVSLYVCGITPYDTTHLGQAFTYVMFDVLQRHMSVVHRWPVRYVQNLTDIDDDAARPPRPARTGASSACAGRIVSRPDLSRLAAAAGRLRRRPPARCRGSSRTSSARCRSDAPTSAA
ncbi:MAG: hypothetical protein U0470_08905 [Anaerolineae bacterium]